MKITLFSAENCPSCGQIKTHLKNNKKIFDEINLSKNPEKAMELRKIAGIMSVPVIIIEKGNKKEIIVGFNKAKLNRILGI